MTTTDPHQPHDTARAGIRQIEGYLLLRAEQRAAEDRARSFCDTISWLTTAQREDIERRYIQNQTAVTQDSLQHVARRARELRTEYQRRYDTLRTRLLAGWLLGSVPVLALAWVISAR
jgi:hypothetical protein